MPLMRPQLPSGNVSWIVAEGFPFTLKHEPGFIVRRPEYPRRPIEPRSKLWKAFLLEMTPAGERSRVVAKALFGKLARNQV
jgi:hypothetical protein